MFTILATVMGLSADDLVKVIGAIGGALTLVIGGWLGGYAKVVLAKNKAVRRRSFAKIRRLEDLVEELAKQAPSTPAIESLIHTMKKHQRDNSDKRDAACETDSEETREDY